MTLRELLRKKSAINRNARATFVVASEPEGSTTKELGVRAGDADSEPVPVPEFTFLRTTTTTEEIISIPSYPGDDDVSAGRSSFGTSPASSVGRGSPRKRSLFRTTADHSHEPADATSPHSPGLEDQGIPELHLPVPPKGQRKFSDRLRAVSLSRKSSRESIASPTLPPDLGAAPESVSTPVGPSFSSRQDDAGKRFEAATKELLQLREAQWEKRATKLALDGHLPTDTQSAKPTSAPSSPFKPGSLMDTTSSLPGTLPCTRSSVDDPGEALQRAITLHESGDFEASTLLFAALADEGGPNIPIAQVLYGLSLRHGWGTTVDLPRALHYLSLAARTSAGIEATALGRGERQGGAAKGELVIAIFELANCFRRGWGTRADGVAARTYYECAANLGDLDAMEELAVCLIDGIGGPKDKFGAARYLRLAEQKGRRGVGNSWIWKDKYNSAPG